MNTNVKGTSYSHYFNKRALIIAVIIIVVLAILCDFGAYGNIRYGVKWLTCGQKPVGVKLDIYNQQNHEAFDGTKKLVNPGLFTDKTVPFLGTGMDLYCSEYDARQQVRDLTN